MDKFAGWLVKYTLAVQGACIFTTAQLKQAFKAGKSPQEIADINDKLYAEYGDQYREELIAA